MNATEISFGMVMLLQISIGVAMNAFLLLFYTRMVSSNPKRSFSDLILAHLALANTIILLTLGVPETISIWGLRNFLGNVGCKVLIYLYRVARGLAICTTCLLSVFQAVTISPTTSWWAGVKARLPRYVLPSCTLALILNMLVDFDTTLFMTGPQNGSRVRMILDLKYCSKVIESVETALVISVVLSLRDLLFVGLMSLSSGYMVFVLHRHHGQVRHLRRPGHSQRAVPEVRVAKKVVALVAFYVLLYGRQSVTLSVLLNTRGHFPLLVSSHMVLSFTFSALSPFLVMHGDRRMRTFWRKGPPLSNVDDS
ncbi:vomeronasal 1 receptor ornAnaV1R3268 [Ornithorhynchus anatinus]|uniref:Vomeronasal type-1 receptor n=1 Tax=Ornithorhynchus anatinus TaxID=9258 RepID=A0A6I8NGV6_ORNAN|nr:vomeronasal 1 receptor ornAnaV1R3268 [Ornithorhynchus anatinus]